VHGKEILDLKKKGLVYGRKPNYYLADKIIVRTGNGELKARYIKQRGFDDEHYKKLILEYLRTFKEATRGDFEILLTAKLPEILNEKQKRVKISNLLSALRREKKIRNKGTNYNPRYIIV